jgi:hypothetical protein
LLFDRRKQHVDFRGALPKASIATTVGGSLRKNGIICARRKLMRMIGRSAASTPCNVKTALDVSTPMRVSSDLDGSFQ